MAIVLLASDLASLRKELRTTLEGPDLLIEEVANGPEVIARVEEGGVDLVVLDLQIGTMGGMAICMELRHEESYGAAEPVAVLMLLDRRPDVFLARRSGAEGFLVKRSIPNGCEARCEHCCAAKSTKTNRCAPRPSASGAPTFNERPTAPSSGLSRLRKRIVGREETRPKSPEAIAIHERVDQLSELELRDVMTPRTDVVFLTTPVTPEMIAEAIRDTGHTCFPVVTATSMRSRASSS